MGFGLRIVVFQTVDKYCQGLYQGPGGAWEGGLEGAGHVQGAIVQHIRFWRNCCIYLMMNVSIL